MCSGIHGLQRRPTDLPKEPAGEEVTLPSHPTRVVRVKVVFFKTLPNLGLHALGSLGARCEHDVICLQFCGTVQGVVVWMASSCIRVRR